MRQEDSNSDFKPESHGSRRPSSRKVLELSLRPRWRGRVLLLIITLAGTVLTLEGVKTALSARAAKSTYVSQIRQALAFDPENSALYYQLGLLYSYLPNDLNMTEARKDLERAVRLNPNHTLYWLNLSSACMFTGDLKCSDDALQRARALSPMRPRVQWAVANHYLQTGRENLALEQFRRLLEMSPEYAGPTFRLCLRAVGNAEEVYSKVLPHGAEPDTKIAFVNFLAGMDNLDGAVQTWRYIVEDRIQPFRLSTIDPFMDALIAANRFRDAGELWADLERLGVVARRSSEERDNLVYNGGFERRTLNKGFDWLYGSKAYLDVDVEDPSAYRGSKCLRVDFTVARNDDVRVLYHIVPVQPNQAYLLTAFVKSDQITSDSGPRLRLSDMTCPTCPKLTTEATVGTTAWHPIDLRFKTGPDAQAVVISVWRPRSRVFPMEITGSFWLDEVKLEAVEPTGQETALLASR